MTMHNDRALEGRRALARALSRVGSPTSLYPQFITIKWVAKK